MPPKPRPSGKNRSGLRKQRTAQATRVAGQLNARVTFEQFELAELY